MSSTNEENQETKPTQSTSSAPNWNEMEKEILNIWQSEDVFAQSLEKTKNGQSYVFYDGPPFATGTPHYGSILPSVIKDAIPRYQTMLGRSVRRRWGWDCHGLPIENIVEKELKISGKKQILEIGVDVFNQTCRNGILRYDKEWKVTIDRVARWVDMDRSYKTMDTSFMESVWWGLKNIHSKGLVYEDRKVLLYCGRCETPISNFEVAMDNSYRDLTEDSVYPKFRLIAGQEITNGNDKFVVDTDTYAVAWTTTPWTLPGNTALHLSPKLEYVVVEHMGQKLILAETRLGVIDGGYKILYKFEAKSLEGLAYLPLYEGIIQAPNGNEHKIYVDDFVDSESQVGTGVVHSAVMYGEEDYEAAKAHNLPTQHILNHKGEYFEFLPETLRGKFFKSADPFVLADLYNRGLVLKIEKFTHSYPHCYRCSTPLYYNALSAWFIKVSGIKDKLLATNESINWYPGHLKNGRFKQGIMNAPDWNISRNRFWATPLPFWKCTDTSCGNLEVVGSIKELMEKSKNFSEVYPDFVYPNLDSESETETYTDLNNLDLHKPYIDQIILDCSKCSSAMYRIPEVVDCWVESGSMPFAELHYPFENKKTFAKRFPSDFVVEYIPQTRAWFYCMHVLGNAIFDKAPFKNVMTTGTILGADGTKMSKSKGNYPDSSIVIEKYGADALRMYLLTSPVVTGEDVSFNEKQIAEVLRRINNIFYNVLGFYRLYRPSKLVELPEPKAVMDKWLVARLDQVTIEIMESMDTFQLPKAGKILDAWINELSTWYVRRSRDRMRNSSDESVQFLAWALVSTSKLLAPFMPYLSDYVYRDVTGKTSVHLAALQRPTSYDKELIKQMDIAKSLVEVALSLRKSSGIKIRQPLARLLYTGDAVSSEIEKIIAEELNVKQVLKVDSLTEHGEIFADPENRVGLDLAMDEELKSEGLARDIERSVQELRKKSGLKVGQLATMYYNSQDPIIVNVIQNLFDKEKTNISNVEMSIEVEPDIETQIEVDGKVIWIGLSI